MTTTAKLRTGTRMSLDEFLDLGETEGKWELDDGTLYVEPWSGTPEHQFLLMQCCFQITNYIKECDPPPAHIFHQITTVLSWEKQRIVEPDIVIILEHRRDIIGRVCIESAPDIIAEVLYANRRRDLGYKRRVYAEAGVREYWPIDPRNDTVTRLELRDGEYVERAVLGPGDALTTPLLPGLSIPLADVFRHRQRPARGE